MYSLPGQTGIVSCSSLPGLVRLVLGLLAIPVLEVLVDSRGMRFVVFAYHGLDAALRLAGALMEDIVETVLLDLLSRDELLRDHDADLCRVLVENGGLDGSGKSSGLY